MATYMFVVCSAERSLFLKFIYQFANLAPNKLLPAGHAMGTASHRLWEESRQQIIYIDSLELSVCYRVVLQGLQYNTFQQLSYSCRTRMTTQNSTLQSIEY